MGQLRFQIGIPRTGSAARSAEQEDSDALVEGRKIVLPRAGSSAKAAEEEKAANGPFPRLQAGFSLRGQNGIVTRNTSVTSTAFNSTGAQAAPLVTAAAPNDASVPPNVSAPPLTKNLGDVSAQPPAGPLQLAASRFQTLVRSLLKSSDVSGKS